jgi:hypothetical protein
MNAHASTQSILLTAKGDEKQRGEINLSKSVDIIFYIFFRAVSYINKYIETNQRNHGDSLHANPTCSILIYSKTARQRIRLTVNESSCEKKLTSRNSVL